MDDCHIKGYVYLCISVYIGNSLEKLFLTLTTKINCIKMHNFLPISLESQRGYIYFYHLLHSAL